MLPGVKVADPARQKMVEQLAQTNSSNLVLDCTPDHHATTSSVRDARWIERDPNADEEPDRRLLAERYRIEAHLMLAQIRSHIPLARRRFRKRRRQRKALQTIPLALRSISQPPIPALRMILLILIS